VNAHRPLAVAFEQCDRHMQTHVIPMALSSSRFSTAGKDTRHSVGEMHAGGPSFSSSHVLLHMRCKSQVDWPSVCSPLLVATVKDEQSHEGVTGEREGLSYPVANRVGGSCSRLC
jgi:hypothetical protein